MTDAKQGVNGASVSASEAMHELRNQIDGARRLIALARRPDVSPSDAAAFLADALDVLQRMENTVRALEACTPGDTADAIQGASPLRPVREELSRYLDRWCAEEDRGLVIVRDYDCLGDRSVAGDWLAIIDNLVRNAMEALAGSGTLTVEAELREEYCVLRVRDTGPGIPQDLRDTLFEPFATSKADSGHAGLGLSICQRQAGALGGGVRSVPTQHGATMEVELPVAPNDRMDA